MFYIITINEKNRCRCRCQATIDMICLPNETYQFIPQLRRVSRNESLSPIKMIYETYLWIFEFCNLSTTKAEPFVYMSKQISYLLYCNLMVTHVDSTFYTSTVTSSLYNFDSNNENGTLAT